MFRCENPTCRKVEEKGISPIRQVVEKRQKSYQNKSGKISYGWEIVREVTLCRDCAKTAGIA